MVTTIDPVSCDRTTVYAGECRNFADTEWIRFDSGRRRSPDARDGNTWLVDVAYGSFWMADDKVRNLVHLVPARRVSSDDPATVQRVAHVLRDTVAVDWEKRAELILAAVAEQLNARGGCPNLTYWTIRDGQIVTDVTADDAECELAKVKRTCTELRSLIEGQKANVTEAQRERDEADRRTAEAEADRDRWKLHHDRVDGQWAKAEREVTKLRRELIGETERVAELLSENAQLRDKASGLAPAVSRADIEKAIRGVAVNPIWEAATRKIIDAVWALHEGTEGAITPKSASEWHDETGAHWNCFPFVRQKGEDVKIGTRSEHVYTVNAAEAREFARCVLGAAIEAEQSVDRVAELAAQIESSAREIVQSAVNALASITGEEVRVDVDGLLADVHPDEWRQMARQALEQEASSDE